MNGERKKELYMCKSFIDVLFHKNGKIMIDLSNFTLVSQFKSTKALKKFIDFLLSIGEGSLKKLYQLNKEMADFFTILKKASVINKRDVQLNKNMFPIQVMIIGKGLLFNYFEKIAKLSNKFKEIIKYSTIFNLENTNYYENKFKKIKEELFKNIVKGVICVADVFDISLFLKISKICKKVSIPLLIIFKRNKYIYIIPLFPQGPCFKCFLKAYFLNREYREIEKIFFYNLKTVQLFWDIRATGYQYFIFGFIQRLFIDLYYLILNNKIIQSRIYTIDLETITINSHLFTHFFSCSCKQKSLFSRNSFNFLESKVHTSDKSVLSKISKLINRETGIINKIKIWKPSNTMREIGSYFYVAECHIGKLLGNGFYTSYGIGESIEKAKIKAICEGLEVYGAQLRASIEDIRACYKDIKKEAIYPPSLILYPRYRYKKSFPCIKFDESLHLSWVKGFNITRNSEVFIPSCFIWRSKKGKELLWEATNNGCASHFSIKNAILHGIYEVIERDAIMITHFNKLPTSLVEVDIKNDLFEKIFAEFEYHNIDIYVLKIPTDINIPVFLTVGRNRKKDYPAFICGAGCNLNPIFGLKRSLMEALFRLKGYFRNSYKINKILNNWEIYKNFYQIFHNITTPIEHIFLYYHPFMLNHVQYLFSSHSAKIKFSSLSNFSFTSPQEEINLLINLLRDKGHEVLIVDCTPEELKNMGIYCVKVFIPGFQPLYFGEKFKRISERALEMPYKLGFVKYKKNINELNPCPHFLG